MIMKNGFFFCSSHCKSVAAIWWGSKIRWRSFLAMRCDAKGQVAKFTIPTDVVRGEEEEEEEVHGLEEQIRLGDWAQLLRGHGPTQMR